MVYIIILIALLALLFGPQFWAQRTFRRYSKTREDIPGSGGELARHLLDRFEMNHVEVEKTKPGNDHYDPESKTVRLGPEHFDKHSLTAIAVATHEVGHAIQHHRKEPMLEARSKLVRIANSAQKLGAGIMFLIPAVAAITRTPHTGILMFLIGLVTMASATFVHFVTLPVEIDASFGKALPILKEGGYVSDKDLPAVKRILRAAAFTYVAASLASLLNIWRWITLFRR